METGTEETVLEETPEEEATPISETPTKSEAEARLEAQIAEMQKQLETKEESYKGLQRTLNKTNEELKKRGDYDARLDDLNAKLKILAAIQSESRQSDVDIDSMLPQQKVDYLKRFDDVEKEQQEKRQIKEFQERIKSYQERTLELGLTENDPEYWDIEDAATNGKFQKAEALLLKLKRKSSKEPTEIKEGDKVDDFEAKVKAEVDKRIAEAAKENPLLKTDEAIPSGRAKSAEDVVAKFAEGDKSISFDDYQKAMRQLGY